MGRDHFSPEKILEQIAKIQGFWSKFALGADILMGFPNETDDETKETLNLVENLPLSYAHVFPYSIRSGTKAALMKGHLETYVRQERAAKVRELVDIKKKFFLKSMLELNSMHLSLDLGEEKNIGWNEYYVSCILDNAKQTHELQKVKAQKIIGEKLVTYHV